jgi:hypothetical protein
MRERDHKPTLLLWHVVISVLKWDLLRAPVTGAVIGPPDERKALEALHGAGSAADPFPGIMGPYPDGMEPFREFHVD